MRFLWWTHWSMVVNSFTCTVVTPMSTTLIHNLVFLFSLVINLVMLQDSSVEMITWSTQTCWNGIYYMIIFGELLSPCLNVMWMIFVQSDETCSMLSGISNRSALHILQCRKSAFLKGALKTNIHGRGTSWPVWTRGLWSVILALAYTAASFDIQTNINDVYLFLVLGF